MYKILFVIIDGVADHKIKELGNKTPLEAAKKKNIDSLCKFSECGMLYPIDIGIAPGSDTGHLSILGYDPIKDNPGRGVFEALGEGIKLEKGDIAFRINFSTYLNGKIIDRRAGRNPKYIDELIEEFIEKLDIPYKFILKRTFEHRGVFVIKGKGEFSKNVTDTDPHKENAIPLECKAKDENSKKLAEIINYISKKFYEFSKDHELNKRRISEGLPPANYILFRGAGEIREIESFEERYNLKACFIAGGSMYKGIARYLNIYCPDIPGANGTVNTSLFSKAENAIKFRDKYDIVLVHIKATDSLSHDKKPREKKKFIEKIDEIFFSRVKDEFDIILLTSDHTTSSIFGKHTADPVPIMIYSSIADRKDPVKNFAERKCYRGILGFLKGKHLMKILLNKIGKLDVLE